MFVCHSISVFLSLSLTIFCMDHIDVVQLMNLKNIWPEGYIVAVLYVGTLDKDRF